MSNFFRSGYVSPSEWRRTGVINKPYRLQVWVQYVLIVLVVIVAYKLYKWYKAGAKIGAEVVSDIKGSQTVTAVKDALKENGLVDVRAQAVTDAANDIYAAFYKDFMWGFGEDEDKAIAAFNGLKSVSEAKACARIYKEVFKKDLAVDLFKYCNGDDWSRVKQTFYVAIKN